MIKENSRRHFLRQAACLAAWPFAYPLYTANGSNQQSRPNIVFILADDLGYGDVGCYGCPDIDTPALDRLATEGVRFTSFYANAPECTPTRTALLTGRYQQRVGGLECAIGIGNVGRYDDAIRLRETHDLGLPVEETSIARMLKDAGYRTALAGKWHLGYEPKFSPLKHGFDRAFGPIGGSADYFHHTEPEGLHALYENGEPVHRDGYMTDLITNAAVQFIEDQTGKTPFFLYTAYTCPHTPYQGPNDQTDTRKTPENWNQGTRETFIEMVERMDTGIDSILQALERKGFADNTLVIFASDNGANQHGRNAPFSGYKGQLFEGGVRVPCIVRWPKKIPAGTETNRPTLIMDFSTSIIRAAGTAPPKDRPFDGIDILNEIQTNQPPTKRPLFFRKRRGDETWKAVREGNLKYIHRQKGSEIEEYLFDLKQDPAEKNNLLTSHPQDKERLEKLLVKWEKDVRHTR